MHVTSERKSARLAPARPDVVWRARLTSVALASFGALAACDNTPTFATPGERVGTSAQTSDTGTASLPRRTIGIGDTLRLTLAPTGRRDRLAQWATSNATVATVTSSGVVVGRALGTAIISGTTKSSSLRLLLTVAAVAPPPSSPPPTSPPPTSPPPTTPPPPPTPSGALGLNADLGRRLLPDDNPWNQPVDTAQVDPNSSAIIANIGTTTQFHPDFGANWNGGPFGIPYVVVSGTQARVPITFDYADESDPGPYPIPSNAPIEGGAASTGDRHVLVVDRDNWMLYETWSSYPQSNGSWQAGSGALFNLNSNVLRPAGWTSADAAGLPILPGLVRYDEVAGGAILHALRFTVARTRRAYIPPATHWASSDTSSLRPPMGMRVRLKATFNISSYPASAQVILRALKKYGLMVADNGSNWYLSGTADARWNDAEMNTLKALRGSDFEVVKMSGVVTR